MNEITEEMTDFAAACYAKHYEQVDIPKDISGPGDVNLISYFFLVKAALAAGEELIAKYGWGIGTVLFNLTLSGAQSGFVEYLKANGIAMSADFHTNAPPSVN